MENTTTNRKLSMLYNGNETIMNAGFTMKSNFMLPVLVRMVKEKIISKGASEVLQTIIQYKHGEDNPFPSQEEIGRLLGNGSTYVRNAVKSLRNSGILLIEKINRKNTYNYKPFFSLLEKFILEYKEKKNFDVKIADLMKVNTQKEEKQNDFSFSENYSKIKEVVPVAEEVKEEEEVVEKGTVELPEEIVKVAEVHEVSAEGIKAIEKAYDAYGDRLANKLFTDKIVSASNKENFVKYFNTCISNAYMNNEQPKQAPVQKQSYNKQTKSAEVVPEWFPERNEPKKFKTNAEIYAESNVEELNKRKADTIKMLSNDLMKHNKDLNLSLKQINARLSDMSLTAEDLQKITL